MHSGGEPHAMSDVRGCLADHELGTEATTSNDATSCAHVLDYRYKTNNWGRPAEC
jgi:hypothetical protein